MRRTTMRIGSRSGLLVLASALTLAPVLALADKTPPKAGSKPSTGAKPKQIAPKPLARPPVRKAEPAKIRGPVYLVSGPETYSSSKPPASLVIGNNQSKTIPSGTTIYWSIKHPVPSNTSSWTETKGSFVLGPGGFAPSGQYYVTPWPGPPVAGQYTTKAWYFPGTWTVSK
jgi:hypothetical protein